MRKLATMPRPHPQGGWYCEYGTGGDSPCGRRAWWVLSSCRDNPGTRPGAVLCSKHRNAARGVYVALPHAAVRPDDKETDR